MNETLALIVEDRRARRFFFFSSLAIVTPISSRRRFVFLRFSRALYQRLARLSGFRRVFLHDACRFSLRAMGARRDDGSYTRAYVAHFPTTDVG